MQVCGGESPYVSVDELEQKHLESRDEALQLFIQTRKMGGDEFSQSFLEKLDEELGVRLDFFT